MGKKLLKTMNGTINNICKWADKEFVEPKKTSRDVLLSLDKDEEFNNEDFEKNNNHKQSISINTGNGRYGE